MNYGHVLNHLKLGGRARRAGWNGKGMFVWIENGSVPSDALKGDIPKDQLPFKFDSRPAVEGDPLYKDEGDHLIMRFNGVSNVLFESGMSGTVVRMPHFALRAADGSTVTGWIASQIDQLAEDWEIIE